MLFKKTLFASAYTAITQICECDMQKLHNDMENKDDMEKENEIQLCIQKSSLLEKLFHADSNKLFQMSKNGYT